MLECKEKSKSHKRIIAWDQRAQHGKYLAAIFLFVVFAYYSFGLLHDETYVWQSTGLASKVRPMTRKSCSWQHEAQRSPYNVKKASIGMVMLYDDSWTSSLMHEVFKNREIYCKKHGCEVIIANEVIDFSRPAAWSKILALEKHIDRFDYLFYVDMDIVIMNMSIRLEDIVTSVSSQTDLIMTGDWNGPNTGVWFAKNSDWTKWFLRTAWTEGVNFVSKRSADGKKFPFEYEQRVFHYLFDTAVWQKRSLPRYGGDSAAIRSHVALLPQCAFNSYSLHPWDWRGNREQAQYVPGDFLIHFAGKKGKKKQNLMEHYLRLATTQT